MAREATSFSILTYLSLIVERICVNQLLGMKISLTNFLRAASTPPSQEYRHFGGGGGNYSELPNEMMSAMSQLSPFDESNRPASAAFSRPPPSGASRPNRISTAAHSRLYEQQQPGDSHAWERGQMEQKFASGVPPTRMHMNNAGDLAGLPGSPSRTPLLSSPHHQAVCFKIV